MQPRLRPSESGSRERARGREIGKMAGNGARAKLSVLAIFTLLPIAFSIDDKCAACNAVAEELERGLANEKPRNHLDMRHRLDSTGQRRGKVIDYRVSDLRVVELLDGLCEKMQDYTMTWAGSAGKEWVRVKNWDNLTTSKQEAKAYSKDISSYCGRLLEETEDELADMIKEGSVKPGGVSKVLCQDLSKHCKRLSSTHDTHGVESQAEL